MNMFGKINTKADTTIRTRADHLVAMRKAIDVATSAAEDAGVFAREIRDYFEGALTLWRQRALYQSDMANRDRPEHAAAVAVAQKKRREPERLASEREWQESVNRRAAEQDEWRR
jgi:hypothetical protein